MGSADQGGLRLSDAQESRYEAWKHVYMGCAVLLGVRFTDVQELRFETAKRSDMGCGALQGVCLLIARNGVFTLRNGQICAELYCPKVDMLWNRDFKVRNVEILAVLSKLG